MSTESESTLVHRGARAHAREQDTHTNIPLSTPRTEREEEQEHETTTATSCALYALPIVAALVTYLVIMGAGGMYLTGNPTWGYVTRQDVLLAQRAAGRWLRVAASPLGLASPAPAPVRYFPSVSASGPTAADVSNSELVAHALAADGGRVFTVDELALYDGTDESLPILVALKGLVFDVSSGRKHYGPGGGYHAFAGRDASRGFVTGCFANRDNHDLRGFDDDKMRQLDEWVSFYLKHETYRHIGRVQLPVPAADSPIPTDEC